MTNLPDDVVARCAEAMALKEWPSDDPKDPITWPGDFSDRERETYHILARAALEAARYGEIVDCLRDMATLMATEALFPPELAALAKAHTLLSSIGTQP